MNVEFCCYQLLKLIFIIVDASKQSLRYAYKHLCVSDSYPEFPVLEARAKSGCELCAFFREALLSEVSSEDEVTLDDTEQSEGVEDHQQLGSNSFDEESEQHNSNPELKDYSGGFDECDKERVHVWLSFEWINTGDEALWSTIGGLRCVFLSPWRHCFRKLPEKISYTVESSDGAYLATSMCLFDHNSDFNGPENLRSLFGIYDSPQESPLAASNLAFLQRQEKIGMESIQKEVPNVEKSTYMPRRVLDLGSSSDSCPKLALFDSPHSNQSGSQETIKYATLSYSWGSPEDAELQLKLTASNFEDLLHEIPFEIMSPVMRDAVLACRVLQIRYLWIDALCIRQHDKQDWEEQSSEMSKVYGNSWVTICAASSSSCQQGFLGKREPRSSIQLENRSGSLRGTYIFRQLHGALNDLDRCHPSNFPLIPAFSRDLVFSKWTQRGWVFQERSLSKRKLIFGANMLHFEQGDYQVSENGETRERPPRECSGLTTQSIRKKGRGIYDFWFNIIEEFCFLEWTESLDVFPALSGIATLFQETTNDEYIAGLWVQDLYCGLLWAGLSQAQSLGGLLDILQVENMKCAPSWSWAGTAYFSRFATECRIRTHLRQEFTLLNSTISIDGANRLGRLKYASLSISGKSITCPIDYLPERTEWLCKTQDGHILYVQPDWRAPEGNSFNEKEATQLRFLLLSSCCSDTLFEDDYHSKRQLQKLARRASTQTITSFGDDDLLRQMFPVEYEKTIFQDSELDFDAERDCSFCSDGERRRDVWGLLIHPAQKTNTYYRVGMFMSRAIHGGSDVFANAEVGTFELV